MYDLIDMNAYRQFISKASVSGQSHALVMHTATWCGPCKAAKPLYCDMADEWSKPTMDKSAMPVQCATAFEDKVDASECGISAFPTFVLWDCGTGTKCGEVRGGDMTKVKALVEGFCKRGDSKGESLGGGGNLSKEEARKKMLERFGGGGGGGKKDAMDVDGADVDSPPKPPAKAKSDAAGEEDSKMDTDDAFFAQPNNEPIWDEGVLKTLTESMGFPELRAKKGLMNGGFTTEGAIDWLMQHQDDADIDEEIDFSKGDAAAGGGVTAQSYKCNECGKVLSNMANLELHANKTGHSDFAESNESVKPLTEEEKKAKIAEIKSLLAAKRAQREAEEKAHSITSEKARRFMGKEMSKTREEMEAAERKRLVSKKKREKEAEKRERERIRAELEKDKLERRANGGKLKSNLGVDGYNPSAIQYDVNKGSADAGSAASAATDSNKKPKIDNRSFTTKIEDSINKVSQYKAGGDGGKCLKILHAYVKNVCENPEEVKFKTINTENKAYKTKVKPFVGAKALLMACGFNPSNDRLSLILADDADKGNIELAKQKLAEAMDKY